MFAKHNLLGSPKHYYNNQSDLINSRTSYVPPASPELTIFWSIFFTILSNKFPFPTILTKVKIGLCRIQDAVGLCFSPISYELDNSSGIDDSDTCCRENTRQCHSRYRIGRTFYIALKIPLVTVEV
jgi:hypothetical protein